MTAAPTLSPADIRLELDRIFKKEHRAWVAAIFGTGQASTLSAAGRTWRVVPTRSELELRAQMPMPLKPTDSNHSPGVVFLIDWTERPLPLDLGCRLAGGRVWQVSRETRLASLFGARQAEAGLMSTGLASVLLSGEVPGLKKVSGIHLSRHDMVRHFLHAWADFPLTETLTPARLASWCVRSERGLALTRKAAESEAWQRVVMELREFVAAEAGPAAELIWRAWERDQVRRFVEVAVLIDAHTRRKDPVAYGLLQGSLGTLAPGFGPALLEVEAREKLDLNALLVEFFGANDALRTELLKSADALVAFDAFDTTAAESPWLPKGHQHREKRLAEALDALLKRPDSAAFASVRNALRSVEAHHLDAALRSEPQRQTRELAAKLAAWWVQRAQAPGPGPSSNYQPAVDLACAYAEEGGFVDWCRGSLRGPLPFHEPLNRAIHRLLKATDVARRDDDQRFATALLEWYAAGKPSNALLPIERVTKHLVADLLAEQPERKLLVILMDGMSWATAVQLMTRLELEQWEPILWRPQGHKAKPHFPPVIAALPTLTNVSRAALFAGRFEAKAGDQSAQNDAARWASNLQLIRANDEAALPELVLRAKLMDDESLANDVKKAIEGEQRVVGVVVNAIDEDLKGSSQVYRDYSRLPIKPLNGLLSAAAGAERLVLLCSDHGHVLGDAVTAHRLPLPTPQNGGSRWRTLGEDETVQPFEIELPKSGAWCPAGSKRVAAIWDAQVGHKHPSYGAHGGLSLAETVAPALLFAPKWLSQLKGEDSAALATRPFPLPRWWTLDVAPPRAVSTSAQLPAAAPAPLQAALFPTATPVAAPASLAAKEPALVAALRKSATFKANVEGQPVDMVAKVLEQLSIIVEAGGALGEQEFARRCQDRPHRVPGIVGRMGMVLNIDGYALIEYDRGGKQVRLHKERLSAQYGVSE